MCSPETSDRDAVISAFLANIQQTNAESAIEYKLYEKIRGNDYVSSNVDLCYLCQKIVDGEGIHTGSCYWTHKQITTLIASSVQHVATLQGLYSPSVVNTRWSAHIVIMAS